MLISVCDGRGLQVSFGGSAYTGQCNNGNQGSPANSTAGASTSGGGAATLGLALAGVGAGVLLLLVVIVVVRRRSTSSKVRQETPCYIT